MNINTRIIRNTIKALRELKSAQETLMYEDCIRRATAQDMTLEESGNNVFEALGEDDRNEIRRFFPLAFLPEDAQSLPLDLETSWEKTYRVIVSTLEGDVDKDLPQRLARRGLRPRAFFAIDAPGQAIGRLGALGVAPEEGSSASAAEASSSAPFAPVKREDDQSYTRALPCAHALPTDTTAEDCASSSSSEWDEQPSTRKRGRSEGAPDSPMHPGMEWLSSLPNEVCVSFVRKCIEQNRARRRGQLASGFVYGSMGTTERLERCVALSETRLRRAMQGPSAMNTTRVANNTAAETAAQQSLDTCTATSRGPLLAPAISEQAAGAPVPSAIPASAFLWTEVALDFTSDCLLEKRAESFVCSTLEAAIPTPSALMVGICASRRRFSSHWDMSLPEGVKALLQIPLRGELHVGSVLW